MLCRVVAVKSLPVHYHSAGSILFPLGSLNPSWLRGGGGGRGVCVLANYSVAYEETQSNRVSDFRDFVCSLFPKQSFLLFILLHCTPLYLVCRVATVKVSPYIIIVQVLFYFLCDHWTHPGYFENGIPLKPALGGVCSLATIVLHIKRLNRTESPISILCVLCFQMQSILPFILLYCSWCCTGWPP